MLAKASHSHTTVGRPQHKKAFPTNAPAKQQVTLKFHAKGSHISAAGNLKSCFWKISHLSDRVVKVCKSQSCRFTVSLLKHVDPKGDHWKIITCFAAGQAEVAECFAVHCTEGLLNFDSKREFPDLSAAGSYIFESGHNAILDAPTLFSSGKALRESADCLAEMYSLDEKRTRNLDKPVDVPTQLIDWMRERRDLDGGFNRKPNSEVDEGWSVAFQRPGSDIMQRTGIATEFYMFFDLSDEITDLFKESDTDINVLPLKFVAEDGGKWVALCCFGDRDSTMAEVNVIDLETRSLLMIADDKPFPDLQTGQFVEIIPADKILKSKNRFVKHEMLSVKINSMVDSFLSALRVLENESK